MKVNLSPLKFNNNQFNNTKAENSCSAQQCEKNTIKLSSVPIQSMRANYLISFSAAIHNDVKNFHNTFEEVLPKTLKDKLTEYIENPPAEISKRKSPYHLNSDAFGKLADCHTVDDIKTAFPDEPLFRELKPAYEYDFESMKSSPLKKFMTDYIDLYLASDKDNPVFKSTGDVDLTVYLAKKAFLECHSQNEIEAALESDINENFNIPTNNLSNVPVSLYDKLGILYYYPEDKAEYDILPEEGKRKLNHQVTSSRFSLVSSRDDFNRNYGDVYQKAQKDRAVEKLVDKVLTYTPPIVHENKVKQTPAQTPWVWAANNSNDNGNSEKTKYTLMLAWNSSPMFRQAWKEHLNNTTPIMERNLDDYNPNLMKLNENQVSQMNKLISLNPKLKEELTENCGYAYDKVQDALKQDCFDDLKAEIEANRQAIIEEIRIEKEKTEENYQKQQVKLEEKAKIDEENKKLAEERRNLAEMVEKKHGDDFLLYTPRIRDKVVNLNVEFLILNGNLNVINNEAAHEKLYNDVNRIAARAKLASYNYLTTTFADMIFKKDKDKKRMFLFGMQKERENKNDLPLACLIEFILNSKEGSVPRTEVKNQYFERVDDSYKYLNYFKGFNGYNENYFQAVHAIETWKNLFNECEKTVMEKGQNKNYGKKKNMDLAEFSFSEIDKEYDNLCRLEKQHASKKPNKKIKKR